MEKRMILMLVVMVALLGGLGFVKYKQVEAAIAAGNGLGMEKALRAVTIEAAQILGIQDRVGSLTSGKDADVVLFDGDPFEYTSHVLGVIVSGQVSYQGK